VRRSMLLAAFAALLAAGLWHLPATAQHAASTPPEGRPAAASTAVPAATQPASGAAAARITFAEYREFRMRYIAQRLAALGRRLASPGLAADEKARLERVKAYYEEFAAMPVAERDRVFRARFDQIDTDHDGTLDAAERAAWRVKRQQYYSEVAAERAAASGPQ
jgi:tellurite resistance protein